MGYSKPFIQIDLNEFKLHLNLKNRPQRTFYFDSPSRRFYLCVITLIVNEMKKSKIIKSIPLSQHLELLALLNESIGGAAGSSDKENLLPRIYRKWKDALPNLEEAPLFRVHGKRKEEEDAAISRVYSFSETEKDDWANLFEYVGSHENVRLRFAIDKVGLSLNEISIAFGNSSDGPAWDRFIAGLKEGNESAEPEEGTTETHARGDYGITEPPSVPSAPSQARKISWLKQYRWVMLVAMVAILAGPGGSGGPI